MAKRVFISYAHAEPDAAVMAWAAATLRAGGVSVWSDAQLSAQSGMDLNAEIAAAIESSSHVVVLLSGMAASSRYCQAEITHALAIGKPMIRVDLDALDNQVLPQPLLPLAAFEKDAAKLHALHRDQWLVALAEACARQALPVDLADVDAMALSPFVQIVRPNYGRLKGADPKTWQIVHERLAQAQAIAPANGYAALNLSLLRSFLGEGDRALQDAETAIAHLPHSPDAYFAAALAGCVRQKRERRSKPENDVILSRLATARRFHGAGRHVWWLAALVTAGFYDARYMTAPEPTQSLLSAGLEYGVEAPSECQRAWDCEADKAWSTNPAWRAAAAAYGVRLA